MGNFRSSSHTHNEHWKGQHRFEHWYRDNSVYFITARCRDRFHAFESEQAKAVFWDRFEHYTALYGFVPWITTLIDNHYHFLGYQKDARQLGQMMQRIHGSVAKLVNDLLPQPHLPFWRNSSGHDYFDGCLRDDLQCRRAYRYTLTQCRRHGLCAECRDYPHTRVRIDVDRGVRRALELGAFMTSVRYPRYDR
jgi:hypothetical protein